MRLHRDKRQLRGRNVVERIFDNTLQTSLVSDLTVISLRPWILFRLVYNKF